MAVPAQVMSPTPGKTAGDIRLVRDVMRAGVVLCDADASVRDVARTMRDRRVRSVLAVDISSELVGLVDERALAAAFEAPDDHNAASLMDPDPLILAPEQPVDAAARLMLARGATVALVAPPPPELDSGPWSLWKERGLPLGTISVADILSRLDELAAQVRSRPAGAVAPGRRVAPAIAVAAVVVALILVLGLLVVYALGTHPYTHRPGL